VGGRKKKKKKEYSPAPLVPSCLVEGIGILSSDRRLKKREGGGEEVDKRLGVNQFPDPALPPRITSPYSLGCFKTADLPQKRIGTGDFPGE